MKMLVVAILLSAGVAACKPSPLAPLQPAAARPVALPVTSSGNAVLNAAEPFEVLTEEAFAAPKPQLTRRIADADAAARRVRAQLPDESRGEVDALLANVAGARDSDDRAAIALSAVEVYRILVSSADGSDAVPTEVKLMDYAGFRYQADLQTAPPHWEDARGATAFGRDQWAHIAGRVADPALRTRVDQVLADLASAAASHNVAAGARAATAALALVDDLETYFTKHAA